LDNIICASVRIPTRAYHRFDAHESEVNAIKWSPHGTLVATAGADRKIKLWDVSKGSHESKGMLTGSNGAVMSLDFDAGGNLLLASSSDFASRVWSLDDMRLRHTLTGHSAKIYAAKFMGDNTRVCSGSHDKTLKVWDLRSRACVNTFFPGSNVHDLVCLDQQIISGHFDKKLRFYDIRTGTQPTQEILLEGRVTSTDLSKNGLSLLACSRDDSLSIFDLRAMRSPKAVFQADGFHVGFDYTRAVFSPDSDYVAVGSGDGAVFIWSVNNSASPVKVLRDHKNGVVAVAWQPAGNGLMSCDKSKQVIIWADV
jgi:autophagy-related protein 16